MGISFPQGSELRFLNSGVDICIEHCRNWPWEPDKFASREDQKRMLESLIDWVKQ